MADTVESLEREVAQSRARLADTIDRLTSPETSEAVKQDLMETVNKTKDDVLTRARDTSRQTAQSLTDTLKQRAMDNPFAVALIGAGIDPVEADAPTPSTLERVGDTASSFAERARDIGESARGTASATVHQMLDTARDVGERARDQASAAAARVSDTVSGTAAQVSDMAANVASQVSDAVAGATSQVSEAASRARETLSTTVEQTTSRVAEAGHGVAETAHDVTDRMIASLDRAQRNPVVLGAAGLAAGFAIARSVRATETGERVLDYATDTVAVGARQAGSGVSRAAARAADTAGNLAASARSAAEDLGATARQTLDRASSGAASAASAASEAVSSTFDEVKERMSDLYGQAAEAASSAHPSSSRTPSHATGRTSARVRSAHPGGAGRGTLTSDFSQQFQPRAVAELDVEEPDGPVADRRDDPVLLPDFARGAEDLLHQGNPTARHGRRQSRSGSYKLKQERSWTQLCRLPPTWTTTPSPGLSWSLVNASCPIRSR